MGLGACLTSFVLVNHSACRRRMSWTHYKSSIKLAET